MANAVDIALRLTIPCLVLTHLYFAPYTKVEESFNIQAVHDILTYGIPTPDADAAGYIANHYDHVEHPGSVPRSFIGAVVLSGLSRPFLRLLTRPAQIQWLVRAILGLINAMALVRFQDAVNVAFGRVAGRWYIVFQATQFHVMFYASRTLPNMLAFAMTTEASRQIIMSLSTPTKTIPRRRLALYSMTLAAVIFRSEIALLLAAHTVYLFLRHKAGTRLAFVTGTVMPAGTLGGVMGLVVTVAVDSYFWRSPVPLWPELQGFIFNTVQGHSSEWGVSPFYQYFVDAVPRLLLNPMTYLICIPVALWNPTTRAISVDTLIPLGSYLTIYSMLPHKEWRFIVYIVPSLTSVAAAGAAWIWSRRAKSPSYRLLSTALVLSVPASLVASTGLLWLSSQNYPGAHALQRLHELVETRGPVAHLHEPGVLNVYLDNLVCQTGVTRFLQRQDQCELALPVDGGEVVVKASPRPTHATDVESTGLVWRYDKTTNATRLLMSDFWVRFDYILSQDVGIVTTTGAAATERDWELIDTIRGFDGVSLSGYTDAEFDEWGQSRHIHMSHGDCFDRLGKMYLDHVRWASRKYTNGKWPRVRFVDKVYILARSTSSVP